MASAKVEIEFLPLGIERPICSNKTRVESAACRARGVVKRVAEFSAL